MTDIVLPRLNQTGKNEWSDVESNDVAIREVVNGELDNENLKAAAGIVGSKLANETIEAGKIKKATITDAQVAAANKDGETATASMRTLGTGAKQAAAGNDSRLFATPEGAVVGSSPGAVNKYLIVTISGTKYRLPLVFNEED